jgi:hypothetical protein
VVVGLSLMEDVGLDIRFTLWGGYDAARKVGQTLEGSGIRRLVVLQLFIRFPLRGSPSHRSWPGDLS